LHRRAAAPVPLSEAEALRAALAEALSRAGRLVSMLKAGKREKRVLASVWSGLQRHFGGGADRT
jgi:hypothetical protein